MVPALSNFCHKVAPGVQLLMLSEAAIKHPHCTLCPTSPGTLPPSRGSRGGLLLPLRQQTKDSFEAVLGRPPHTHTPWDPVQDRELVSGLKVTPQMCVRYSTKGQDRAGAAGCRCSSLVTWRCAVKSALFCFCFDQGSLPV